MAHIAEKAEPSTSKLPLEALGEEDDMANVQERNNNVEGGDIVEEEANLSQTRNLLNDNSIQLWKDPYYDAKLRHAWKRN